MSGSSRVENASKQAKLWGVAGEDWIRDGAVVETWFAPVTEQMMRALPADGGVVLDVGCGARTMQYPVGWKSIGLDIANEMLPDIVGDETVLPFAHECFDAVTGRFSYMFSVSPFDSFCEAVRVLRKGGVFVFSTWAEASQNEWASVPMDYLCELLGLDPPAPQEPHAFRLSDREEVRQLLLESGLDEVEVTPVGVPYFADLSAAEAVEIVLELAGPIRLAFHRIPEQKRSHHREVLEQLGAKLNWAGRADVWTAKKVVDKREEV